MVQQCVWLLQTCFVLTACMQADMAPLAFGAHGAFQAHPMAAPQPGVSGKKLKQQGQQQQLSSSLQSTASEILTCRLAGWKLLRP